METNNDFDRIAKMVKGWNNLFAEYKSRPLHWIFGTNDLYAIHKEHAKDFRKFIDLKLNAAMNEERKEFNKYLEQLFKEHGDDKNFDWDSVPTVDYVLEDCSEYFYDILGSEYSDFVCPLRDIFENIDKLNAGVANLDEYNDFIDCYSMF